jgi:hypothetical protein
VSAQLVLSDLFPLLGDASPPANVITSPRRVTLLSYGAETSLLYASSFGNASFCHLPSRAEIETLNSHHRCRPPSPNSSISFLHYYKNIISILATLFNTQSCLYFTSSLIRASCHHSFTRRHHSFSSPSQLLPLHIMTYMVMN